MFSNIQNYSFSNVAKKQGNTHGVYKERALNDITLNEGSPSLHSHEYFTELNSLEIAWHFEPGRTCIIDPC